jgi:predicted metallopeptidase
MVRRLPELRHINMDAVAVSFCQTRRAARHGLQATLTPLRCEAGSLTTRVGGTTYVIERLVDSDGRDYLYLLSFYLPRFLNLPYAERVETVLHELWHIGPRFDGDLRRHHGRFYIHGPSAERFDQVARTLARTWRSHDPPAGRCDSLRFSFRQLVRRHEQVVGLRIAPPKLVPLEKRLDVHVGER